MKAFYVIIEKVMSAIVIIPSRYHSTRFPGKPLALINDRPMIQHVYERAKSASLVKEVIVATDSSLIFDTVQGFGGSAVLTSEGHVSGADRIAEAAKILLNNGDDADIIVNVQGDEPMIRPDMIDDVIGIMEDRRAGIGTLVKRIHSIDEVFDPNVVKVVFNGEGFALYFSRSAVPYHREAFGSDGQKKGRRSIFSNIKKSVMKIPVSELTIFKHIGIYAYRADALKRFSELPASRLEEIEKLEQLRALENRISIKVKETIYDTVGVDTPADLEKVKKCLNTSS
jgi:3-deoxy-manno-octulosonate cytidylyltransferase (CMP-KDO synthetase)